jgi:hypothetical protein
MVTSFRTQLFLWHKIYLDDNKNRTEFNHVDRVLFYRKEKKGITNCQNIIAHGLIYLQVYDCNSAAKKNNVKSVDNVNAKKWHIACYCQVEKRFWFLAKKRILIESRGPYESWNIKRN